MKKHFRPTLRWIICMMLDCVRPTQFSVIRIIHRRVGLMCFFNFTKMFVIIVMYAYFIDISQGSVETHLRCGGICDNHVIANCLQSVPVKEFWKSMNNICEVVDKSKVPLFYWPTLWVIAIVSETPSVELGTGELQDVAELDSDSCDELEWDDSDLSNQQRTVQ